jgi:hypothetical protein
MLGLLGGAAAAAAVGIPSLATPAVAGQAEGPGAGPQRPRFEPGVRDVDIALPHGKLLGSITAVAISPVNQDIFLMHYTELADVLPAPAARVPWIVRLDKRARFISAWGGPDQLPKINGESQWPTWPENVEIDDEGNVWLGSWNADAGDNAMLRFTPDGRFLSRIGQRNRRGTNADTHLLGAPPSAYHNVATREVFVADGYANNRIISFDVDSGEFKRMWGAGGDSNPAGQPPEARFGNPVHKITKAPDGRLLVCDRAKNRIQEFEVTATGVSFVREITIAPGAGVFGTVSDVVVTPDNKWMYVVDMTHGRIWIINRTRWEVVGWVTGEDTESYQDQDPDLYDGPRFSATNRRPVHRVALKENGDLLLARTRVGLTTLKLDRVR